jgi:hypothetical protein
MPSRTPTPDLPAVPGLVTPPVTAEPTGPPERADTETAGPEAGAGGTASVAAGAELAWGEMRLVPVPDGWPPYDCEMHGAACAAAAPEAGRPSPRPAAPGKATGAGEAAAADEAAGAGEATAADEAAGAGTAGQNDTAGQAAGLSAAWPRQFAQVLVEILAGFRPAKQLAPWATERVRAQVDLLSRAADAHQHPRIRRVMTSRPTAGVVEMTMVVGFGSRPRALAMRFEHVPARPPVPGRPPRPARWLCTEIETR